MIMIGLEEADLGECVALAQQDRVVITRRGKPVALIIGVEGLDQEQLELGSSDRFWQLITERRGQPRISRAELEQRMAATMIEGPRKGRVMAKQATYTDDQGRTVHPTEYPHVVRVEGLRSGRPVIEGTGYEVQHI